VDGIYQIGIMMSIQKHNESIVFDQVLGTTSGAITGVIKQPVQIPDVNVGVDSLVDNQTAPITIQEDDPVPEIVQEEVNTPTDEEIVIPIVPDPSFP
jgi:hypothetical protein